MNEIPLIEMYVKVGDRYYRQVDRPEFNDQGEQSPPVKCLYLWNKQTIVLDHGKDFVPNIRLFNTKHELPSDLREMYEVMPKKNKWLHG
jgi:hypothetical protein